MTPDEFNDLLIHYHGSMVVKYEQFYKEVYAIEDSFNEGTRNFIESVQCKKLHGQNMSYRKSF